MTVPASLPARSTRSRWLLAVLGLLVLAAAAWSATAESRSQAARTPTEAVVPGGDGIAEAGGLRAGVVALERVDDDGLRAQPGHQLWHLELYVDVADSTLSGCEVLIADDQGREFGVGVLTPSADGYQRYAQCAPSETGEPVGAEQAFLVLTPQDAVPQVVRIESYGLVPHYLELPLPEVS